VTISLTTLVPAGGVHPVRVARAIRGLTQADLEQLAGLPRTTLSHVERGRRTLNPSSASRVAEALNADPDALTGERRQPRHVA